MTDNDSYIKATTYIKATKISSDKQGKSFFSQIQIKLNDKGEIGFLSNPQNAKSIIFRITGNDYDYDWHNAPQKQYIVILEGEVEIEVSTGEKKIFGGGDVLLVEDVEGQGHRSRAVSGTRKSIFVTL